MLVALLLAFLLVPLTFLLRFAGYAAGKQSLPALAALVLGIFLLFGFIPAAGSSRFRQTCVVSGRVAW